MQITETRKAIIELIEPYMSKDFSFGCLVKNKHSNEIEVNTLNEYDPIYFFEFDI